MVNRNISGPTDAEFRTFMPGPVLTAHDRIWYVGQSLAGGVGTATWQPLIGGKAGYPSWRFSGAADQYLKLCEVPMDGWKNFTVRLACVDYAAAPAGNMAWQLELFQANLGENPGSAPVAYGSPVTLAVPSGALGSTWTYPVEIATRVPVEFVDLGAGPVPGLLNLVIQRNGASDSSTDNVDVIGVSVTRAD